MNIHASLVALSQTATAFSSVLISISCSSPGLNVLSDSQLFVNLRIGLLMSAPATMKIEQTVTNPERDAPKVLIRLLCSGYSLQSTLFVITSS